MSTNTIIATKIGMTQIISEDGAATPTTLLKVEDNEILQVKTEKYDGYNAIVIGSGQKKFKKNKNKSFLKIIEHRTNESPTIKKGEKININAISEDKKVSISSISKGKGFSGVIKRHNFHRGPETHGSHHHREPGSVGMCAKPARILKGKKMPGQYGATKNTRKNIPIMKIDIPNGLLAIKGPVAGPKNSLVFITQ